MFGPAFWALKCAIAKGFATASKSPAFISLATTMPLPLPTKKQRERRIQILWSATKSDLILYSTCHKSFLNCRYIEDLYTNFSVAGILIALLTTDAVCYTFGKQFSNWQHPQWQACSQSIEARTNLWQLQWTWHACDRKWNHQPMQSLAQAVLTSVKRCE